MSTVVEKLRDQCMERGATGIIGLSRAFRLMDDNRDRKLDKTELKEGLEEYGLKLEGEEIDELFEELDADESGNIIFDEFLKAVRPPMSQDRLDIIDEAFQKLDATGEGVVTLEDLRGVYTAAEHPKYISGEMSEDEVLTELLNSFDSGNPDGKVTKQDFINYYAGVSASIDDDEYFTTMMRGAWQL